jgi:hypothetical protein
MTFIDKFWTKLSASLGLKHYRTSFGSSTAILSLHPSRSILSIILRSKNSLGVDKCDLFELLLTEENFKKHLDDASLDSDRTAEDIADDFADAIGKSSGKMRASIKEDICSLRVVYGFATDIEANLSLKSVQQDIDIRIFERELDWINIGPANVFKGQPGANDQEKQQKRKLPSSVGATLSVSSHMICHSEIGVLDTSASGMDSIQLSDMLLVQPTDTSQSHSQSHSQSQPQSQTPAHSLSQSQTLSQLDRTKKRKIGGNIGTSISRRGK